MDQLPYFEKSRLNSYYKPVVDLDRRDKRYNIIYPDIMVRKLPKSASEKELSDAIDSIKELESKVDYVNLVKSFDEEKPWSQVGFIRLVDQSYHAKAVEILSSHFSRCPLQGKWLQFTLTARNKDALVVTDEDAFEKILARRKQSFEKRNKDQILQIESDQNVGKSASIVFKYYEDDKESYMNLNNIPKDIEPNPNKPNPYECTTERTRVFVENFYNNVFNKVRGLPAGYIDNCQRKG